MLKADVYINGIRIDLFDDERIKVVSSVQNISDISRTFNDYSQSFTVPGSKNNNIIFEHYYNANINGGFDARVRHPGIIYINSIPFKSGALRLEGCEIRLGKIHSYKLTFFGLLIDLKEVIGDDYLSALDFSDLDIAYTSDNVKTGITTGFSSEELIFPLISTKRQWYYNSNGGDTTDTTTLSNISYNGGAGGGMDWESFRPALKISSIIDKIESSYGLTFSDDFLLGDMFSDLYLWLANSDSEEALKNKNRITTYTTLNTYQPAFGSFDNDLGAWNPTDFYAGYLREIFFEVDSSDGIAYSIRIMNNDQILVEETGTGDLNAVASLSGGVEAGSSIYGVIVTTEAKTIDFVEFYARELSNDLVFGNSLVNLNLSGSTLQIFDFMPKIKVLDFLKSILKMYNCVIVPTSSTEFTIETLDDWYAAGATYDISEYVDRETWSVNRSKIFKEIAFKFLEPKTILAVEYRNRFNTAYGDLETKLRDANGLLLDGGDFEIELNFEQMIYERLINTQTDVATNIVYGLSWGPDRSGSNFSNGEGASNVLPESHIFYARSKSVASNTIGFKNSAGTLELINGSVYMPAHSSTALKEYSTAFGSEIDEHDGGVISNSLYLKFYKDYITDSFSSKRRLFKIKARFPVWLLSTLNLNDKLVIDGDRYLINQITTDVTDQTVDIELLNDIYNLDELVEDVEIVEEETTPTPPTPTPAGTSFNISANGFGTSAGACSDVPNATKYANTVPPILGTFIYNDVALSSGFDGNLEYYKLTNGTVVRIAPGGIVIEVFTC